jgi:hypothetical protein
MISHRAQDQSATGKSRLTGAGLLLERVSYRLKCWHSASPMTWPHTPVAGTLTSLAEKSPIHSFTAPNSIHLEYSSTISTADFNIQRVFMYFT